MPFKTNEEAYQEASQYYPNDGSVDFYLVSDTTIAIPDLNYRFFVDEEPLKGWPHKCSIVTIPIMKGNSGSAYDPNRVTHLQQLPANYSSFPFKIVNRYGINKGLKMKVGMATLSENDINIAEHTYAIILSGGHSPQFNYERYWNDCSYIYQTLRNKYGIPKSNIMLLMADGNNPGKDMNTMGAFKSSPTDLDFDNQVDLYLAATKNNVKTVFHDLSQKLTDQDHLFIYVIDHGGSLDGISQSYIALWNQEQLKDGELSEMLDKINARSVSVLLGQCNSGGFLDNLQKSGRVIATACTGSQSSWSCPDIPYDEFVFQWTNGMNKKNGYTHIDVNSDFDNNKYVGMDEAFNYAKIEIISH